MDSQLEAAFGGPSDDGFGSSVFRRSLGPGSELESIALDVYRYFVGVLWDRYGEDAWLAQWGEMDAQTAGGQASILDRLSSLPDPLVRSVADMLVNGGEDADSRQAALKTAFDKDQFSESRIYRIGDGEAMSGLIIAGANPKTVEAVFVAILMD